jgi:hypothetical protein
MSVHAISQVWRRSQAKGSELLLMLAIADYAHDDGTGAYPAIPTLAGKMRMSERNVQLLIRKREAAGELVVEPGVGLHGANMYRITLLGGEKFSGVKNRGGVKSSAPGGEKSGSEGVKPASPKPSENRHSEPSKSSAPDGAGHPPKTPEDEKPVKPISPADYCVRRLVERIKAAKAAGKRVEPLPNNKRGEYGNFYEAYLKDGRRVEELEPVLDRLVERASGRNGTWIPFGWAASDVEVGYAGEENGSPGAVHPQSDEAARARDKPRRPEWYAAVYGGDVASYERMIAGGLSHSEIVEGVERGR